MLFNSLEFLFFFFIVYLTYWLLFSKNIKWRNGFLLLVSYVFYGWWDPRFLLLMFLSSSVDFLIGIKLSTETRLVWRKALVLLSIFANLGVLGFFKYFNFFQNELIQLFESFGVQLSPLSLNIILPVGISFYTFQTMSYSIDVYNKKLEPTRSFLSFFAFVSFFPQLVAGPIERATNLIHQFDKSHAYEIEDQKSGLRQILWGFFKKLVIADNCAPIVNDIFAGYSELDSLTLFYGTLLFAFQIYADFSGYSDIAIGLARMFGFKLMTNFAYPYFSRDMAEFWRRWHISLSTWFRDYLYIPIGGSKGSRLLNIRNVFIIFIVSGFWHGANWTFIAWGAVNALMFLPLLLLNRNRRNLGVIAEFSALPTFREAFNLLGTFSVTCVAWIFFRSESITDAFSFIELMFDMNNLRFVFPMGLRMLVPISILVMAEWLMRRSIHPLEIAHLSTWQRWTVYYVVIVLIIFYFPSLKSEFIYFQF